MDANGDKDQSPAIAIVGYGCRFPDDAVSPEAFFEMLAAGRSAWSEVPANRYNIDSYWHPNTDRNGITVARGAHWMKEDPALFDAPSKRLRTRADMDEVSMTQIEAAALDPQLRMLLEVVYETLENAGIPLQKAAGSNTSVFVGSSSSEYMTLEGDDIEDVPLYTAVGTGVSMLANRLSHFFDFRGPSVALDTACSAGMVAVHLGCQSLRTGEARTSIVAASQLMLRPDGPVALSRLGFLSPDSRCYTFDDRANGYARGEGICAIALKRVEDALADGDHIHAVIRGTLCNQDGRTPGIVQPNAAAQAELIAATYKAAGLSPDSSQYFEAHGTGTTLGDPLEVKALVDSMGTKLRSDMDPLYIGSVKTNIGHLEGCAGLAGLLKTILSVEHGVIFPSLNFENPNPRLLLDDWRLKVPRQLTPWPTSGLRRASINSFGYGGTNAHCIIDDAYNYLRLRGLKGTTAAERTASLDDEKSLPITSSVDGVNGVSPINDLAGPIPRLFVLSSPEQAAVSRMAASYHAHLSRKGHRDDQPKLEDLAFTLGERRSVFQWRTSAVAASAESLQTALDSKLNVVRAAAKAPSLLFVFTGQGAQFFAMGRELLKNAVYAKSVHAADLFFTKHLEAGWSVIEELTRAESASNINQAEFSQPLCTVIQVALVDLMSSCGIKPSAVVGHSSGEIAAAYAAGTLTAEGAWTVAFHRGRLSQQLLVLQPELKGKIGMMAVGLSEEDVKEHLKDIPETKPVVVACCNSPESVTLSGSRESLEQLESHFKDQGIFARQLKVEIAYHSPYMQSVAKQYLDAIDHVQPQQSTSDVVMYSTVTGESSAGPELDALYWIKNMCSPVQFVRALETAFPPKDKTSTRRRKRGDKSFDGIVELGPHGALQAPLRQILTKQNRVEDVFYLSALKRGKDAYVTFLETTGALWCKGYPVKLGEVNSDGLATPKILSDLPSYTFNHDTRFWYEKDAQRKRLRTSPRHDLIGTRTDRVLDWRWRNILRIKENPWLSDHQINGSVQLSPPSLLCTIIEAGRQLTIESESGTSSDFVLSHVTFPHPVAISETGTEIYTELWPENEEGQKFRFFIFTVIDERRVHHCTGNLEIQQAADLSSSVTTTTGDMAIIEPTSFYRTRADNGMAWGKQYQLITSLEATDLQSKARITLADTRAAMPAQFEYEHLVHPTSLDACFQGLWATFKEGQTQRELRTIDHIRFSSQFPRASGDSLTSHSSVSHCAFGTSLGKAEIVVDSGEVVLSIDGVHFERPQKELDNIGQLRRQADIKKMASNLYWKPDVQQISNENAQGVFSKDLLLTSSAKPEDDDVEQSIPSRQASTVPDTTLWKAFAAKWLELCGHKSPTQVILEIVADNHDADLHSFTHKALNVLGGKDHTTPICQKYIRATTDKQEMSSYFEPWNHFLESLSLDLQETEPKNMPVDASVDVVFVTGSGENHPVSPQVLQNALKVLRAGGRLIFANVRRAEQDAIQLLENAGFLQDIIRLPLDGDSTREMLVAQKKLNPQFPAEKAVIVLPNSPSSQMSIFSTLLRKTLNDIDLETEEVVWNDAPPAVASKLVICLLEAEQPYVYDLDDEAFEKVKAFFMAGSKGGVWLTRGITLIDGKRDPRYSATTGLIRTMRNEKQDGKFCELGLSPDQDLAEGSAIKSVIACLKDVLGAESIGNVFETEVGELNGLHYIPRIYDEPLKNRELDLLDQAHPPALVPFSQHGYPSRLAIANPDDKKTLRFVSDEKPSSSEPLGEYEVDIEVQAHGVMSSEDLIEIASQHGGQLGVDAAGVVTAVGSRVTHVQPGDIVAALIPGAFRTHLRTRQDHVVRIPAGVSVTQAACFPSTALLACYVLNDICRIRQGDAILIPDTDDALSHVLVRIGAHLKAEVFLLTSASVPEEVAGSYDIPSQNVMSTGDHMTETILKKFNNGRGLDVVINVGDVDNARYCSEFGKTINIDLDTARSIPIGRGPSYIDVSSKRLFAQDGPWSTWLTDSVRHLLESCLDGPSFPHKALPYSDMMIALDLADDQQSQGHRSIALELRPQDKVPVLSNKKHTLTCRPDATYLVLGGMGGLGRWLCTKLAEHGARHIATFSRSGASTDEAKTCIAALTEMGVSVKAFKCDVADPTAFQSSLNELNGVMPSVRGVVHATMVLRDNLLEDMPAADWHTTARNKIQGALNMHEFLPKDLDFMVFVSSISPIMGNSTQANYATGNAFLDGLTFHRRSLGLPATVVNFGLITGVGFVAENLTFDSAHSEDWQLNSIAPPEVWAVLESAMTGYLDSHSDVAMPPQILTCAGSGGLMRQLKHIETFGHAADPKYKYLNRLDAMHEEDAYTKIVRRRQELSKLLENVTSLYEAQDTVESAVIEKIAAAIPMPLKDVDPQRPVADYGVDSLIANEIRNWAFNIVKANVNATEILSSPSIIQLSTTLTQRSALVKEELKVE